MADDFETVPIKEVTFFKELRLPVRAGLVGYSALIEHYDLNVPRPRTCSAVGEKHRLVETENWKIFSPRYKPSPDLEGQLTFALKHEGVNLIVLKKLFEKLPRSSLEKVIKNKITGKYARKIWFLYEWLLNEKLNINDVKKGNYVPILDPDKQLAGKKQRIKRQRVFNNLPGTRKFCPLVFKTEKINKFLDKNLTKKARGIIAKIPEDIVARAASFLLLKDSKSSFDIEKENPSRDRIQRWGRAIKQAGQNALDSAELLRLQEIVIGDSRFVDLGWRETGGFVGERDRRTSSPLPDHISAKPEDIEPLVDGLVEFCREKGSGLPPVVEAALLAFGFVYIHPFQDGNGRIHRYLLHHVLARRGFNPPGVVFPISAVILEKIEEYRQVLEDYADRLMPCVKWEETEKQNIKVLNDTADFYRYFDATLHAEFLYECVEQTIEEDLPEEIDFLKKYDTFCERVNKIVDMPDKTLDLLFNFLEQNNGRLSKRARNKEFESLTEQETARIEKIYKDTQSTS